jgi:hypothetical protein
MRKGYIYTGGDKLLGKKDQTDRYRKRRRKDYIPRKETRDGLAAVSI